MKPGEASRGVGGQRLAASIVATVYALHVMSYITDPGGDLSNLLWLCNVGLLLIALGLTTSRTNILAVGFFWVLLGTPLWFVDVLSGGSVYWTSYLTHGAGTAVGGWALSKRGLPAGLWWKVPAAFAPLQALTRVATPEALNINLSQRIYPAMEGYISSYPLYIACHYVGVALALLAFESGLRWAAARRGAALRAPHP